MADTPTSPCMVAHHETEKNRFYYVNYAAILFNKIALSENVQMGISTDNLGMGLSAILKGVYQVRAIGSGTTLPPSVFTHTVPASMTVGASYQVAFSGVTSAKGAVTYTLSSPANLGSMLGFSKSTGILADENITVSVHADTGGGKHSTAVPGNYSLEVLAYAGQTLVSKHTVNFTLVAAVLTGTINHSSFVTAANAGATGTLILSGVTSNIGTPTYSISEQGTSYFTFSKTSGIAANENVTWSLAAGAPTGTVTFSISANISPSASNGPMTVTHTFQVTAAAAKEPVLTGTIAVSGPSGTASPITAGSSTTFRFSGVTADTGTVTYSIANSGQSYFTFSKSTNIAANEAITVTAAANTPTGSYNFIVHANTSPGASNGPITGWCSQSVTAAVVTPTLSGTISHNIPSSVTAGSNYSVQFGGKSATSGTVLYSVNINSGSQYVTFSKTSGIAAGETIYLSVASNAPNGGSISGTISANTSPVGASNGPDSVSFSTSTVAIVEPDPTFSGFSHTVPANTQQGQSYTVTFSGTSSSNGRQVWYSLSPQSGLSFSKLDKINPGEAVTLTIGGSATGTLGVTVYANTTKKDGSTFTKSVSYIQTAVAVPAPTLSGTIQINIPATMTAGATGSLTLSGVTSNTGTPTYSISEQGTSYFTFSKTSGITAGENVTWSLAAGAPTRTVTFNASANTSPTASNGPMTGTRTVQVNAAAPTMSGTISHNIPSSVTAAKNYSVQFGGKSATSGTVLYSVNINSGSQYVTFSKTSGIAAGETVTMSVASNAPNGGSIKGTISANTSPVSASNGPDSVSFSTSTVAAAPEPDPTFSGFSHTLPRPINPSVVYTVTFTGTSSSNGRPVWYSVSPNNSVVFSKVDNISPGEAVTMKVPGGTQEPAVTVYANTTKNDGSKFTKSMGYFYLT